MCEIDFNKIGISIGVTRRKNVGASLVSPSTSLTCGCVGKKHVAKGMCGRCYDRERQRKRRAEQKQREGRASRIFKPRGVSIQRSCNISPVAYAEIWERAEQMGTTCNFVISAILDKAIGDPAFLESIFEDDSR